jgi:hypothetical protein
MTTQRRFSKEFKDNILRELQPPENKSVGEISARENIPKSTLYGWVRRAREDGQLIPNNGPINVDKWRQEDRARIVNSRPITTHKRQWFCLKGAKCEVQVISPIKKRYSRTLGARETLVLKW